MQTIYPVLMVGGAGTRLWPVSRKSQPKQFQKLVTGRTMFQETVMRVSGTFGEVRFGPPVIIGADIYKSLITSQLEEIGVTPAAIILEPFGRNTAPVAAIAAEVVKTLPGDGFAFLLPSDHHITGTDIYRKAVAEAAQAAGKDRIMTFGIAPTRPETGYGYIRAGEALAASAHRIDAFVEKPDLETAAAYVSNKAYSWNAGMFLFHPDVMLDELNAFAPDVLSASRAALAAAKQDGQTYQLDSAAFSACSGESVDYAVMEKTSKAAVYGPVDCGWSDIGSWQVIAELAETAHTGDVIALDTENCYIRADEGRLIAAVGVSDLIIVAHENTVLIMPASEAQRVKDVVEQLKDRKDDQYL